MTIKDSYNNHYYGRAFSAECKLSYDALNGHGEARSAWHYCTALIKNATAVGHIVCLFARYSTGVTFLLLSLVHLHLFSMVAHKGHNELLLYDVVL